MAGRGLSPAYPWNMTDLPPLGRGVPAPEWDVAKPPPANKLKTGSGGHDATMKANLDGAKPEPSGLWLLGLGAVVTPATVLLLELVFGPTTGTEQILDLARWLTGR